MGSGESRNESPRGPTRRVLMNNSGADPPAAIGIYRDRVLPALRGARSAEAARYRTASARRSTCAGSFEHGKQISSWQPASANPDT